MEKTRTRSEVALSSALTIAYSESATPASLKADQARRQQKHRFRVRAVWTLIVAAGISGFVFWNNMNTVREATIERSKTQLSVWQKAHERLAHDPVWPRFAASSWAELQRNVSEGQKDLVRIQANPGDQAATASLAAHMRAASDACRKLLPETMATLERQSREPCPQHKNVPRLPEYQSCMFPHEGGTAYLFPVWKEKDGFHWRMRGTGNYQLSAAESKIECPAL
jgi:hypothetical protein